MNQGGGGPLRIPPDQETGSPIEILLNQEAQPSSRFLRRIRQKIDRRMTASQVASFSWNLPRVVLLEMVGLIGHLCKALGTHKEPKR